MADAPLGIIVDPRNPALLEKLYELEKYDFSSITSDAREKLGWDEPTAAAVELQFKRFLSLNWLDPGRYHIPEINVDEYWHRAILHTKWYAEFCRKTFGSFYHHTPLPDPKNMSVENRDKTILLISYWYGDDWKDLVRTCTQCEGPEIHPITIQHLAPSAETMPS